MFQKFVCCPAEDLNSSNRPLFTQLAPSDYKLTGHGTPVSLCLWRHHHRWSCHRLLTNNHVLKTNKNWGHCSKENPPAPSQDTCVPAITTLLSRVRRMAQTSPKKSTAQAWSWNWRWPEEPEFFRPRAASFKALAVYSGWRLFVYQRHEFFLVGAPAHVLDGAEKFRWKIDPDTECGMEIYIHLSRHGNICIHTRAHICTMNNKYSCSLLPNLANVYFWTWIISRKKGDLSFWLWKWQGWHTSVSLPSPSCLSFVWPPLSLSLVAQGRYQPGAEGTSC